MRKFLLLLSLPFLTPAYLFAQSNFKPGYALSIKGDTIKGYIDYREWSFNPESIDLKLSPGDKQARHLTTQDITYFEVTGLAAYGLYQGPITMDDPNNSHEGRDTSTQTGLFFLKILQRGTRLAFYSYTDNIKTRFFIQDQGGRIEELVYHSYYVTNETGTGGKQVSENTYFRQLAAVAQKYNMLDASMLDDLQHADYYKQNLLKIVSRINSISAAEYKKQYNEPSGFSFAASLGVNLSSISPTGYYAPVGGKSATSVFPAISVEAGLYTDPETQQVEFLLQGIVSGNQYQSIYIYTGSPYVPVKFSYHQLWVAVAPQVRYNFYNTRTLKLFVGAGIALTFHDYSGKYDLNYAATQVTNGNLADFHFYNNFTMPVIVRTGARFSKRVEIFGAYFAGVDATTLQYIQTRYSSFQFGISYIFK